MPLMGTRDGSGNVRGGDGEKEGVGGKGSGITSTSNNHALDGHELVDVIGVEFAHVGGLLHVEGPHLDGPEALLVLFVAHQCRPEAVEFLPKHTIMNEFVCGLFFLFGILLFVVVVVVVVAAPFTIPYQKGG